jgi:hypothetical protein
MRRETDIGGDNYELDRAVCVLYARYERIYYSLTEGRYILVTPAKGGGVIVAVVAESGLLELARHINFAGAA